MLDTTAKITGLPKIGIGTFFLEIIILANMYELDSIIDSQLTQHNS